MPFLVRASARTRRTTGRAAARSLTAGPAFRRPPPRLASMFSAFWLCATTTTISSVVSLGYSAAAIRSADGPEQTNARYAFSRSLALTTVTAAAVSTQSTDRLKTAAVAMTLVQAGDAVVGLHNRDRLKTFGPALTAAANLAALINLDR
jgi:hypothetical protein